MEQILIQIPEGHVIDTEQSNLEEGKIVFKKKEVTPWRETKHIIVGYYIDDNSDVVQVDTDQECININSRNKNIFANKKQARSMLAMAQLSQIIKNDERFGGPITDREWKDENLRKYVIARVSGKIIILTILYTFYFS